MAKGKRTKTGVSPHQFGQVPRADIPRSSFNLSHGVKTTFDCDYIVPVGAWDVIPGDSWNCKTTTVARLATPLHPLQDNLYIDHFYFFVPYRTIWDSFEKMMGAQEDPGDSIDFTIPRCPTGATTIATGDLGDYMGLPIGVAFQTTNNGKGVSALPFRAYRKIYNEWFRDENLIDTAPWATDAGPDSNAQTGIWDVPLKRAKKHDYFTSALPWPQKQTTGVELPLGTTAPIHVGSAEGSVISMYSDAEAEYRNIEQSTGSSVVGTVDWSGSASTQMYADLSTATAATINELRLAMQTQRLLERDARSGTRYVETLKAHWGVTFPDYTAQRSLYLGGGTQPVGITPVPQTTEPTSPSAGDAKGALAGYGYSSGQAGFVKSFVEHGVILALINARGDITYSQGVDRYWQKETRYDFYYPVLSGIGEQSIANAELFYQNDGDTNDNNVFGYTGRYNEYRYLNSKLTGLTRPDATNTLASWNLSEDFASLPTLGQTFIEANTSVPLDRAIAVPSEPHFIADIWHDIKAARPLPLYADPVGLGRF